VASCKHSGSTNDIIAWQQMDLFEAVEIDNKLPMKYFFIGDEAFTHTQISFSVPGCVLATLLLMHQKHFFIISPLYILGRGSDRYKDSFNYWLSHSWQTIERSFGILTQCWGIFRRSFTFSFDRAMVVMVWMKLHNLCIDCRDAKS
jgi:hypothetical protein